MNEATTDVYRAPRDDAEIVEQDAPIDPGGFYVVETRQMVLFEVLTLGLYTHYWFYKHWQHLRREHGFRGIPILRAAFPIFFVHALFRTFDRGARRTGFRPRWSASGQAGLVLGIALGTALLGRAGPEGALIAFFGRISFLLPLAAAQNVANLVSGVRQARSGRASADGLLFAGLVGAVWFGLWWFAS